MFYWWFYLVENQKGKIENPAWHFYLSTISKSLKWVKCLLFNVANFNPWNFAVEAINKSIASLVLCFFFKFLWRLIVVSIISLVNGRTSTFSKNVCQKVSWSALLPLKPQSKRQPKLQNIDDFEIIGIKRNLIFPFF